MYMSYKILENKNKNCGIGSDQSVAVDDGSLFHAKQNEGYAAIHQDSKYLRDLWP